jgi:hypothetical protein
VPLISLSAVVMITGGGLAWGIPLIVFLWLWGPVANSAKGLTRPESPDRGGSPSRGTRGFLCGVASGTLFATKYVAVVGLLTTVFVEFALRSADYNSWTRMIESAYFYMIYTGEGWLWFLLPGLGIALLAASVYVIIGEFERIFRNLSKT